MVIETTRLQIVPLTIEQFRLLLCANSLDPHTQQAMEGLYNEALNHPNTYWWYTNWQIILKAENKSIGSACFMKEPNEYGQVEIGYGINDGFRNHGYMTEAAKAICDWALQQDDVESVVAETETDNYASHRVLEKCGMQKYKRLDESLLWRLEKIYCSPVKHLLGS
jgi:RimJ/RimL family protein N-acetyltransferase